MEYLLCLGSNMGRRVENLRQARLFLGDCGKIKAISGIYETRPVDMAPNSRWFLNQAVKLESWMTPLGLLAGVKEIERRMGRSPLDPGDSAHQPRPIDIDILAAEGRIFHRKDLVVPHPRMAERAFVLCPLREIAPEWVHPELKRSVAELAAHLCDGDAVRRIDQ